MGLPQTYRLKRRQAFKAVYKKGLRCRGRYLTLRALPVRGERLPPPQFGIAVSQKVSKKAVVRNRIKRQLRAAFKALLPQIQPGWKVVAIAKPGASACDYQYFLQELEQLLVRAEVSDGSPRGNVF
ncbi:MAG: ribonuclease P protein component [Cyanobacteria bacterium QS_8_64_29]|nr:MAG: ribonuclease P protein component [Cyanobacteria bacterium QS_8_64_29]